MALEQHGSSSTPELPTRPPSLAPTNEPGGTPPRSGWASLRAGLPRNGATVLVFVALALLIARTNELILGRDWRLRPASSQVISGDEPHYLLVIHSLLFDRDLQLKDDYVRIARGGLAAGRHFRGFPLDHHTLVFDPATGQTRFWHEVFDWGAALRVGGRQVGYLPRDPRSPPSPNYEETPSHPVAYPALVALLLAPFSPSPVDLELAVNRVQQLFCWLGALAVYLTGRRAGFSRLQAESAAVLLVLASPWLAYSRSFFSEPAIALMLTLGLWALQSGRPVAASLAVSLAMAIKPPFVLFGAAWILLRLIARRWGEALRLAVGMGTCGLLLLAFNRWQFHVWLVSGSSHWAWASGLSGLWSTLLHPAYGLLVFVPWTLLALGGLLGRRAPDGGHSSLTRDMGLPLALYLGVLSAMAYNGSACYGPRYWVAVMPWLALAAIECARRWGRPVRWALGLTALAAVLICAPGALRYGLLWDTPASQGWPRG